jgi:hypothetical protein
MDRIAQLHSRLQITVSLVLVALIVWGLICYTRGALSRGYGAGLAIVELLIVAEGALGLILLGSGAMPRGLALHIVYGAVAALVLPAVHLLNRGRRGRWEALTFAAACLFLLGIAIRAYQTGQ